MGVFRQFPYSNFHEMNMDEIIKIIKNMLEEWAQYHAEWDAWMDEINDDWSNYQEVMNEAWQNMQDFINNYFDNLDVQNEINNKITSMVNSGEFATIVDPFIPPRVTAWLSANITQPVGVVIDKSLSVAGACADAKATGDAINADAVGNSAILFDNTALVGEEDIFTYSYTTSTGYYTYADIFEVEAEPSTKYTLCYQAVSGNVDTIVLRIDQYNGSTKLADHVVTDTEHFKTITTSASCDKIIIKAIIVVATAPTTPGTYRVANVKLYKNKLYLNTEITSKEIENLQNEMSHLFYEKSGSVTLTTTDAYALDVPIVIESGREVILQVTYDGEHTRTGNMYLFDEDGNYTMIQYMGSNVFPVNAYTRYETTKKYVKARFYITADSEETAETANLTLNVQVLGDMLKVTTMPFIPNSIIVDANGRGDYTNIQDAIDSISDDSTTKRYNIIVLEGTYPRFETKPTGSSTYNERYINIIGIDMENTIVESDVGLYSYATNVRINGVVKNITFKMTNTNQGDESQETYHYAYAVHADFGSQHTTFENCKFYSNNGPGVGFGLSINNSFLEFIGCYFECNQTSVAGSSSLGALFGHSTNSPNVTGMKLILNNCICNNITGALGAYITQLVESTSQSFIATNSVFLGNNGADIGINGTWNKGYSANNNVVI